MDNSRSVSALEVLDLLGHPTVVAVTVMLYVRTGQETRCGGGTFEGGQE